MLVEVERLRKERDEARAVLRNVLPLLDKVWDHDADVFGILHNDAVDVEADIRRIVAADQEASASVGPLQ